MEGKLSLTLPGIAALPCYRATRLWGFLAAEALVGISQQADEWVCGKVADGKSRNPKISSCSGPRFTVRTELQNKAGSGDQVQAESASDARCLLYKIVLIGISLLPGSSMGSK